MSESVVGAPSSASSRNDRGDGSMIAQTITAKNNAPTLINNEIIDLLRFSPRKGVKEKADGESVSEVR